MRSIQVWLEEIVQQEFGQPALAGIRAVASERQSGSGVAAKAVAFVDAIAEVRQRTVPQTYSRWPEGLVLSGSVTQKRRPFMPGARSAVRASSCSSARVR